MESRAGEIMDSADEQRRFRRTAAIAINRVYTRRGDAGTDQPGQRPARAEERSSHRSLWHSGRAEQFRRVWHGNRRASCRNWREILLRVQHELFNLGAILATMPEDVHPKQARITAAESEQLEREIDRMNEGLPPLRSFVLPGGSRLNAELHICRTVCRRAERVCVGAGGAAATWMRRF